MKKNNNENDEFYDEDEEMDDLEEEQEGEDFDEGDDFEDFEDEDDLEDEDEDIEKDKKQKKDKDAAKNLKNKVEPDNKSESNLEVEVNREKTEAYIRKMTDISLSDNIDAVVKKVNDKHDSELLNYYCQVVKKYFDQEDSDKLIDFKETKLEVQKDLVGEELRNFKTEMELLGLIEYVYMMKYDKLIKKLIYQTVKNRFFYSNNGYNPMNEPGFYESMRNEAQSFAIEGFLIGIRRYTPNSKTKLITYVTWWIQQRIVYFIEKYSTINKGHKVIVNDEDMVEENRNNNGDIVFNKYANVSFENYNFVKTDDVEKPSDLEKLSSFEDGYDRHNGKIYDIIRFFCENKDLFLYFEYLIIKYDILLEEYIHFIENVKDERVKECFFSQITEVIDQLRKRGYPDLEDFEGIRYYHKLPETLGLFFNLEKSEYLQVKRVLKQKLINILKNVFLEKKPNKKRGGKKDD